MHFIGLSGISYPLVNILLELSLITVSQWQLQQLKELVVSIIKNWMQNRMRDEWLNDFLVRERNI